jgi:predicted kinase
VVVVVPARGLVLLIGASGSGKSTFARRHFAPTQILSSDAFRAMVGRRPIQGSHRGCAPFKSDHQVK